MSDERIEHGKDEQEIIVVNAAASDVHVCLHHCIFFTYFFACGHLDVARFGVFVPCTLCFQDEQHCCTRVPYVCEWKTRS